jgi:hypothetical protein
LFYALWIPDLFMKRVSGLRDWLNELELSF